MILDEAHQLPDTATLFFGEQVTAGQLAELARDAEVAARTGARDVAELPDAAAELAPAVRKLRLAAGEMPGKYRAATSHARERRLRARRSTSWPPRSIASPPSSRNSPSAARRSRNCAQRARRGRATQLARWRDGLRRGAGRRPSDARRHGSAGSTSRRTACSCRRRRCRSPPLLRRQVDGSARAWIFTSATLAVGKRLLALQRAARPRRRGHRLLGQPVRLRVAGAALRAARPAAAQLARAHRRGRRRRAAACSRRAAGRAFLLFTTLRALAPRASCSPTRFAARRPRLAAARAGRRLAHRAARALSRARQRDAARQRELLGRRGRAGRRAVARRHRQAAVRAARRSAARGAARRSCAPKAAIRSSTSSCRRR